MLYEEERKRKIVEYIQQHTRASVPELSNIFQVSESTVRRDLSELEEAMLIKRTHGGAVCLEGVNFEPTFLEIVIGTVVTALMVNILKKKKAAA